MGKYKDYVQMCGFRMCGFFNTSSNINTWLIKAIKN